MNRDDMKYKKEIEIMMREDYKSFVKALISIEQGVEEDGILEEKFQNFMQDDTLTLLDERI